jgi:hypothetical protein
MVALWNSFGTGRLEEVPCHEDVQGRRAEMIKKSILERFICMKPE